VLSVDRTEHPNSSERFQRLTHRGGRCSNSYSHGWLGVPRDSQRRRAWYSRPTFNLSWARRRSRSTRRLIQSARRWRSSRPGW